MRAVTIIRNLIVLCLQLQQVLTTNTADRIKFAGYSSETHDLVTKDGYGLTIFRIKNATTAEADQTRPVVLVMHGLTSSSDGWVIRGLRNAVVFEMVDNGYDVWLGNARGTPYGLRHVSMSPNDRSFWRFSWHEIGIIDLPTTIDYILKETGQSSLHYMGHSQGTAIMFVLLSTQPEYNSKLKTSHMYAPIAYMKYARSPLIQLPTPFLGNYSPLDPLFGDSALFQQPILRKLLGFETCRSPSSNRAVCGFVFFLIYGGYSAYFDTEALLPEAFNTHPASASAHQAIHLVQLHVSNRFRQYDFGTEGNLRRYNRTSPPDYEVSNINPRFPMHFYYSDDDELASKTDVEKFSRILGNKTVDHFIGLKNFAHIDFVWASNIKEVINADVLRIMNEAEVMLREK